MVTYCQWLYAIHQSDALFCLHYDTCAVTTTNILWRWRTMISRDRMGSQPLTSSINATCRANTLTHPGKQETFSHCWCNVGPPSTTLTQHYSNSCLVHVGGTLALAMNVPFVISATHGKHEISTRCWVGVGTPSSTLVQHWSTIVLTSCVCRAVMLCNETKGNVLLRGGL